MDLEPNERQAIDAYLDGDIDTATCRSLQRVLRENGAALPMLVDLLLVEKDLWDFYGDATRHCGYGQSSVPFTRRTLAPPNDS